MPGTQRRWPVFDATVRKRIRARIADGMNIPMVAESLGFSAGAVRRIVNEMGGTETICREENGPVPVRDRPRTHYCIEPLHWMRRAQKRAAPR